MRRRGVRSGWPLRAMVVALLPLIVVACAQRRQSAEISDAQAVSVDVGTLWKQEAASDPITAYRIRIASDPDNAGLHNNLGNQYVLENMMDEALGEFRTASRLDRRSPVPWNNMRNL